jgi:hypothetical protein
MAQYIPNSIVPITKIGSMVKPPSNINLVQLNHSQPPSIPILHPHTPVVSVVSNTHPIPTFNHPIPTIPAIPSSNRASVAIPTFSQETPRFVTPVSVGIVSTKKSPEEIKLNNVISQNDDDQSIQNIHEGNSSDYNRQGIVATFRHTDAYLIRQIIEMYNSNLTSAPLVYTPQGLYILRGNAGPNMIIFNKIRADTFVDYYINPELANAKGYGKYFDFKKYDKEYDESNEIFHIINLNLSDFHSEIKSSVARKEQISITQRTEDNTGVYFKVHGGNRNAEGGLRLSVIPYNHEMYNIPKFASMPNRNIPISEFSNLCTQIKRVKGTKAVLKAYSKCIILCGDKDSGNSSRLGKWGEIEEGSKTVSSTSTDEGVVDLVVEDDDPTAWEVDIPRQSTSGMAKSNNLCSNGIIRMFCNKDGLAKLQIPYWCGEMQIILFDPKSV